MPVRLTAKFVVLSVIILLQDFRTFEGHRLDRTLMVNMRNLRRARDCYRWLNSEW